MIPSLINALFPEAASDSTEIEVPAPIFTCCGVLKNTFNGDVASDDSAVAKPETPVKFAPDPKKDVALTTPTTFNFSVGDVELTPTLLLVSTVKTLGLPNFDTVRALVIAQLLSSYLGHKKDHLVY